MLPQVIGKGLSLLFATGFEREAEEQARSSFNTFKIDALASFLMLNFTKIRDYIYIYICACAKVVAQLWKLS